MSARDAFAAMVKAHVRPPLPAAVDGLLHRRLDPPAPGREAWALNAAGDCGPVLRGRLEQFALPDPRDAQRVAWLRGQAETTPWR